MKIRTVHTDRYSPITNPVSGKLRLFQARALTTFEMTL